MRTCSVWDWDRLEYEHFHCPGKASVGGWGDVNPSTGPRPPPKDPIGKDIEALLPPLPAGCVPVGRSPQARGQIVRAPKQPFSGFGASLAQETPDRWGSVVGAMAAGVLVYWGLNAVLGPERR